MEAKRGAEVGGDPAVFETMGNITGTSCTHSRSAARGWGRQERRNKRERIGSMLFFEQNVPGL
jgi:hypothetical protein